MVCAYSRLFATDPVYSRENDARAAHVEEPHFDADAEIRLLHRPDDDTVGVQLTPPVERDVRKRGGRRDGGVDIARDQRKLPLEVQVVPQDAADGVRRVQVSASRESATKSGTAKRGAAPA